jgi:flagellar biosynthetic protein FlhB
MVGEGMPEDGFEDRTEAPTDKRRSEARNKGNVAKSTEITSALVLLTGLLLLKLFGPWMYQKIVAFSYDSLSMLSHPRADYGFSAGLLVKGIVATSLICGPVCIGIMFIGVLANLLQVGVLFTLQPLEPKFEKINPISGAKRMVSLRSVVELLKNVLKLGIIGFIAFVSVKAEFLKFLGLGDTSSGAILLFLLSISYKIIFRIALVLLLLAILDYLYQRFEHERSLKMTKQEIKEEHKQAEGDPQIKARVRSLQREMARRRMMQEVPKATVVVTNPTHIAIALKYEPSEMQTPKVIAKGKRLIAEQIKKLALEAGVPIVEDKPLARAMYDKVNVGDDIPLEFFTAVAEVLAYVFRLKKRNAA